MMRPYWAAFRAELLTVLQYKANTAFLLSLYVVPPLAIYAFWRAALRTTDTVGGYDLSSLVTYYVITQALVVGTPFMARVAIGENIHSGRLASWLSRPADHYGLWLAMVLGGSLLPWLVAVAGIGGVALVLPGVVRIPASAPVVAAAALFWLGGVLLGFSWGYLLNLLCFWFERSSGVSSFFWQSTVLLSGGVLPLDLLPARRVWEALPFRFAGWFPAQILLGRAAPETLPAQGMLLILWLVVFWGLCRAVWLLGLRRFQGAGG